MFPSYCSIALSVYLTIYLSVCLFFLVIDRLIGLTVHYGFLLGLILGQHLQFDGVNTIRLNSVRYFLLPCFNYGFKETYVEQDTSSQSVPSQCIILINLSLFYKKAILERKEMPFPPTCEHNCQHL